uniref:Uncharacterized protein n=1 Tax=Avena sativa TaxID=4498 RepID=A0ACD5UUT4_AVESA
MATKSTSAANHETSSSRCFTESFTATHNFELANYPLLDGLGVGKYVSSSVFRVGGYDWAIRFYPDGERERDVDCAGCASAFLYCVSETKGARTKFTVNMLEKEGNNAALTTHGVLENTISPPTYDWGYVHFVNKSMLKSLSEFHHHGCFIIRCVLTVIKEPQTDLKMNRFVVPQMNLQDHLQQMWKDGQGADVTFSVGGRLFDAHRCLLAARSSVFQAELFGPMKEKASTQSIKIHDIEPAIFEALLHFVYTDSLPDEDHYKEGMIAKFQHLLVAADRYGLDKLRVLCERKLCESMDVETAATTLVLAEQHHCKDLKEACIEFMAPRNVLQAVLATDGFKHLVESCPVVMKELLDMVSRTG